MKKQFAWKNIYTYISIGLLFFVYIFVRAFTLDITIDELYTLNVIVPSSWVYDAQVVANNHFMNSFLIKLFAFLFGDSFFVARLPNVFAFMVYTFFSYRIVSKNFSTFIALISFIALVCNPFLLDFFSLARGYGLSLAFMLGALYYGIENVKSYSNSTLSKSLFWATLSVFSIFSMIYFWIALALGLNLAIFLRKDRVLLKLSLIGSFIWGFILILLVAYPIFMLVKEKQLFYGGHNSFITDSLLALVRYSMYKSYGYPLSIYITLVGSCILLSIVAVVSFVYEKTILSPKVFILFISLFIILVIIALHYFVGILYPINRSTLYLYPLAILCLFFCSSSLSKYAHFGLTTSTTLALLLNFLFSANFYRTTLWGTDARTRETLIKINEEGQKRNKVMNIDYFYSFRHTLFYHMAKEKLQFVRLIGRPDKEKHSPFLLPETDYYMCGVWYEGCFDPTELANCNKDIFLDYTEDNLVVYTNLRYRNNENIK